MVMFHSFNGKTHYKWWIFPSFCVNVSQLISPTKDVLYIFQLQRVIAERQALEELNRKLVPRWFEKSGNFPWEICHLHIERDPFQKYDEM